MKYAVRAAIAAVIIAIAGIATISWGGNRFIAGVDAYERGDYARAVQLMRPLAELGSPGAQYFLGVLYDEGMGDVRQDIAAAVYWYQKAAGHGFIAAQFGLASMYASGRGIEQDYGQAALWYRKAADKGNADAQNGLGDLYAEGHGVSKDDVEAARWYRKAAEQGHRDAGINLGTFYSLGRGVPFDNVRAYLWFSVAGAKSERDDVATRMTSAEIVEAENLAREWKPKTPEAK